MTIEMAQAARKRGNECRLSVMGNDTNARIVAVNPLGERYGEVRLENSDGGQWWPISFVEYR